MGTESQNLDLGNSVDARTAQLGNFWIELSLGSIIERSIPFNLNSDESVILWSREIRVIPKAF